MVDYGKGHMNKINFKDNHHKQVIAKRYRKHEIWNLNKNFPIVERNKTALTKLGEQVTKAGVINMVKCDLFLF